MGLVGLVIAGIVVCTVRLATAKDLVKKAQAAENRAQRVGCVKAPIAWVSNWITSFAYLLYCLAQNVLFG